MVDTSTTYLCILGNAIIPCKQLLNSILTVDFKPPYTIFSSNPKSEFEK